MVAKIRPLARKSGCPMCAPSIASFIPSAIRRNCLAFIYAFILQKFCSGCFPLSCRLPFSALGDTRSKRASDYLEAVSNDVLPGLRLCEGQTNVNERGSDSHQHSVQDKAGLDSSPHPHTEQESHRKGSQDRRVDARLLAQEHKNGNEHCKDGCFDQKPRNHNPRPMNVLSHVARIYREVQSLVLQKID